MIEITKNEELIDESIYQLLDKYTPHKLRPCSVDSVFKSPYNNRYHYVYVIIHIPTKRFYIGKRSEKYDTDYFGSGNHIKSAVALYGKDQFYKFIVSFHYNSNFGYERESFYITDKLLENEESFNKRNYTGLGWKSDKNNITIQRTKENKNIFCGKTNPTYNMLANGTHNFLGENHPVKIASKNGNFKDKWKNFCGLKPWELQPPKTNVLNLNSWYLADVSYQIYLNENNISQFRLFAKTRVSSNKEINFHCFFSMLKYFKSGWIPEEDNSWKTFKKDFISENTCKSIIDLLDIIATKTHKSNIKKLFELISPDSTIRVDYDVLKHKLGFVVVNYDCFGPLQKELKDIFNINLIITFSEERINKAKKHNKYGEYDNLEVTKVWPVEYETYKYINPFVNRNKHNNDKTSIPWKNPAVLKNTKALNTWYLSDEAYKHYVDLDLKTGGRRLFNYFSKEFPVNERTFENILKKFKAGWIPDQDQEWLKFKYDYKVVSDEQSTSTNHSTV